MQLYTINVVRISSHVSFNDKEPVVSVESCRSQLDPCHPVVPPRYPPISLPWFQGHPAPTGIRGLLVELLMCLPPLTAHFRKIKAQIFR